jgi:hypothetical protein
MFSWFFRSDENKKCKTIDKLEKFVKSGNLYKFDLDPIYPILSREKITVFSCTPTYIMEIVPELKRDNDLKIVNLDKSIYIYTDGDYIFISMDGLEGIKEILNFVKSTFGMRIKKLEEKIEIAEYHLNRIINLNKCELEGIKNNFNSVSVYSDRLEISTVFRPTKIVYNDPAIIKDIPEFLKNEIPQINKMIVYFDANVRINSVKLDGTSELSYLHPNCKNGWYCLGNYKNKELNLSNIMGIINSIKTINLNDCYFIPEYLNIFSNSKNCDTQEMT